MLKEKATHAHLACMNAIVDKKNAQVRKSMITLDKAYSLSIGKAWSLQLEKKKYGL